MNPINTIYFRAFIVSVCFICSGLTGCKTMTQMLDNGESISSLDLPTDHSDELQVSDHPLHESDLMGDPLSVVLGFEVIGRDELKLRQELIEATYNTLSDNWVKTNSKGKRTEAPLKEEIERSLRKTASGSYFGKQKVNYILMARLETSRFKSSFEKPSMLCTSWRDSCPGTCEYSLRARMDLEALGLPSQRRARKWVIKAKADQEFDAEKSCPSPGRQGEPAEVYQKLLDEVTKTLVECSKPVLEDFFASRGYVLSYHSDGHRFLFRTSGGRAAGFSRGDNVAFQRLHDGGATTVAQGKVVSVEQKFGVISVKKQDEANKIHINDRVLLQHKRYIPSMRCQFAVKDK